MKLQIGTYEVEIKAKRLYHQDHFNAADTEALLNSISLWAHEAASWNDYMHCTASANDMREKGDQIYYVLKARGVYDK